MKFAEDVDLASLKLENDKWDIDNLETTAVDLKKLSDAVDKEVVKKKMCMMNWLEKEIMLLGLLVLVI